MKRSTPTRKHLSGAARLAHALLCACAMSGLTAQIHAAEEVIAEYRLGTSTPQITYSGGPAILQDASGKQRVGEEPDKESRRHKQDNGVGSRQLGSRKR